MALDEHRHFVTAAEHCHVTQPTLTMQLKKLEEELGIQLFDRTKKPLKPTPGGEVFIAKARRILMDINDLHASVAGEKSSIKGEFRLGIIPTLAPHLLPLFLGHFVENNPETVLRIEEMESEQIIKALHENRLDVAIMATPTDERNFNETVLFNEAFLFYAPDGHPLLSSEEVEAEKLDVSGMLLLSDGHCFRNQALKICNKSAHESHFPFHYESGSIETLKGLVRKGIGYTLVPELAVNGIDKEHMRRFKSPQPVREVSLVTHSSFSRTLLIEKLKTSIRETLPKHIEAPKEFVKIKWR